MVDKNFVKVRDHCHASPPRRNKYSRVWESKYLGAAHVQCNLKRRNPSQIPCYIHNFMSYDSNFLLDHFKDMNVRECLDKDKISGMPYNGNKFRTLVYKKWNFLDSFQLLNGSLADLVEDLMIGRKTKLQLVQQVLKPKNNEYDLLMKKACYPYEWAESVSKLEQQTTFPEHKYFYSRLSNSNVSLERYNEGKEIFESMKCKNMKEYTNLYCELDTALLAEVVFEFRKTIDNFFGLAVENYISLPQLAFDAMLKHTGIRLEQIHDPSMVPLFEQSIRGGVSFVNNRYEKIEETDNDCILYIDANNLYGFAQKLMLPYGDYKWVSRSRIHSFDWLRMTPYQSKGYCIDVDLEFPDDCHEKLDDFPFAPHHEDINFEMLSPYSKKVQEQLLGQRQSKNYTSKKLVTGLNPRRRYFCHYLTLQLYLRHGAKITKIHNIIEFTQKDYVKPFIDFAADQRAKAATKFAQNLWKLIANALYGKFIQDKRKYTKVRFCVNDSHLGRLLRSPYFIDVSKLNDNLCIVWMRQDKITLDRLYSVGFSILELSKFHMYQTWYDFIKPKFGSDAQLLLTDTDSFVIKFKNHTKHQALTKLKPIMDFSNFPPGTHFHDTKVKKIPGYFKDEYPTGKITEAVAVKSKCYFLKIDPDKDYNNYTKSKNHIVCKGMPQKISINFPLELYKSCIMSENAVVKSTMYSIRAKKRRLQTMAITKQALSSGDDKRYLLCKFHSTPYGSKYTKYDFCYKCKMNK